MAHSIIFLKYGRVPYTNILEVQRRFFSRRISGEIPDICLMTTHEPTITLGKGTTNPEQFRQSRYFKQRCIPVVKTDRGGDVTYHGPGQIVLYPIFDLSNFKKDVGWFVRKLESTMEKTAETFGVPVEIKPDYPGLWVKNEGKKIGSVGLRLKKWVSMHGLSLNVDLDEDKASLIQPCGLKGVDYASLNDYAEIESGEVEERLLENFQEQFEIKLEDGHGWKTNLD